MTPRLAVATMPAKAKLLLLRRMVMQADRSRLCAAAAVISACHVTTTIGLCVAPMRAPFFDASFDAFFGLLGLLLLLLVHRAVWVRLVPQLPSVDPSLLQLARSQWLTRGLGSLAFGTAALLASLAYHRLPLTRCEAGSEAASCAPNALAFTGAWAALVGLLVGASYALHDTELPSADSWPLISQSPFLRLWPVVPGALASALRICLQAVTVLLLLAWLMPSVVTRVGVAALALTASGCTPCGAAEGDRGTTRGSDAYAPHACACSTPWLRAARWGERRRASDAAVLSVLASLVATWLALTCLDLP